MMELLSFIFLIVGVLQIILFFKIWVMTNDIKELRNEFIDYDPYKIYAKTFGIAESQKFLESRPKVVEVKNLDKYSKVICTLSSNGTYEVTTTWFAIVNTGDGANACLCSVELRLSCIDSSVPMKRESWTVMGEATAKITNSR